MHGWIRGCAWAYTLPEWNVSWTASWFTVSSPAVCTTCWTRVSTQCQVSYLVSDARSCHSDIHSTFTPKMEFGETIGNPCSQLVSPQPQKGKTSGTLGVTLLRKALTLMAMWSHSNLSLKLEGKTQTWSVVKTAVSRNERNSEAAKKTKIHQKVVTLTSVWSPAWSKAAQNKTPSDGLIRVAKACRHLFFPNPTSILQIRDEQTGKPQCCKGKLRRWCARGWVRCCERKQLDKFTWPAIDKRVKSEKVAKTLQRKALSRVNKSWEIEIQLANELVA